VPVRLAVGVSVRLLHLKTYVAEPTVCVTGSEPAVASIEAVRARQVLDSRGERVAKYNQLLRTEELPGDTGQYAGEAEYDLTERDGLAV
jgi:Enolase, C-terminal TIM barrel domain